MTTFNKPSPEQILALKLKYKLTAQQIADACMVSRHTAIKWINGQRECPAIAWWMMNYRFAGVDWIKEANNETD